MASETAMTRGRQDHMMITCLHLKYKSENVWSVGPEKHNIKLKQLHEGINHAEFTRLCNVAELLSCMLAGNEACPPRGEYDMTPSLKQSLQPSTGVLTSPLQNALRLHLFRTSV